jgi:hypothetical protein
MRTVGIEIHTPKLDALAAMALAELLVEISSFQREPVRI